MRNVEVHIRYGCVLLGRRLEADAVVVHYPHDANRDRVLKWMRRCVLCRMTPRCKPKFYLTPEWSSDVANWLVDNREEVEL